MPDITAARIPPAGVAALAPLRDRPGVRVAVAADHAWVTWPAGTPGVVECLRPVAGAEFFARVGGNWFRPGCRVPTCDGPPDDAGRPLDAVVIPARFDPVPPPPGSVAPMPIRLVRDAAVRPTTALLCSRDVLEKWADTAMTAEFRSLSAARCGNRVLVRGKDLPAVPCVARFWGDRVLVPLGFRPDPEVPAAAILAAAGAGAGEVLMFGPDGPEAIPDAAFGPLTRAGVRLAGRD